MVIKKIYKINTLNILNKFKEIGVSKIVLFIYPEDNPSRIVAIGRCVPVFLAQYFLKKAKK
jgi:hypothetical protein